MRGLTLAICLVSISIPSAYTQEIRRAFHLTDFTSAGGAQEIATALKTVGDIQQVVADTANADLIAKGTESQLLLAEWMVQKLDVPLDSYTEPERRAVAGNLNDVVDIVELKNADSYASLQEMLTTLRTVADITKINQVSAPRILIFRGNASQISLAEFLISELDKPAQTRPSPFTHKFQLTGASSDVVLIYGLVNINSPTRMQAMLTTLRTLLGIFKQYRSSAPKILAIRGPANTIKMAEWLLPKLDTLKPAPTGNETPILGTADDFLHVFYLKNQTSMVGVSKVFEAIGGAPQIGKTYYYSITPPAIIVRGSAAQLAVAKAIVEATDQ